MMDTPDAKGEGASSNKAAPNASPGLNEKQKGPPFWKKPFVWIFGGGFLVIILGVASYLLWQSHYYVSTNDAYIETKKISIAPDIGGRITKLYVDEGSILCAGDLLVELDDTLFLAERKKAIATQVRTMEAAKGALQKMKQLEEDYDRLNDGYEMGIITRQERDNSFREYQISKIDYILSLIDIKIAEADLGVILEQMSHLKIRAPSPGIVAKRWLWEGDMAEVGQSIFIVNDLSDMWVTANLDEKKLTHVKLGDPVEIQIDSYPGYKFVGKIFTIKAMSASQISLLPPDNATGNFTKVAQRIPIKISIEPLETKPVADRLNLFPGMSAEIKVQIR